ncbi:unnamed protein product, partial [Adineta steineri]
HENVPKNKVSVLLLQGTGGCCDLFVRCYHLYNERYTNVKSSDQTNEDPLTIKERK